MLRQLFAPQLVILYVLVASTIYVHFRGKQRLRFARQLGDHSTYLAPYNVLMYAGSAVPNEPVSRFLGGTESASMCTIRVSFAWYRMNTELPVPELMT